MDPKDLEEFTRQLYDAGLSDAEVADKVAELESTAAQPAAAPAGPKPAPAGPSILSPKTLFPATAQALNSPQDSTDSNPQAFNTQKKPGFFEPFQGKIPGDAGNYTPGAFDTAIGAAGDWLGKTFRLAGSLIPSSVTRGTTQDPTAPMGNRTRTFTESMQNPNGSALTGLAENIDNSAAPAPVKVAGKVLLGAAEAAPVSAASAAIGQTVRSLLSKAVSPALPVVEGAAKYVQNVRMGTTASDINKGASAGNAMKHGLGAMSLENALPAAESKIANWSEARKQIYQQKPANEINMESAIQDAEDKIKAQPFGQEDRLAALEEIKSELNNFSSRTPSAVPNTAGFVPRKPIQLLSQEELQAGANSGDIKFIPGKKFPFEYTKPAPAAPENTLPKEGVYLNLEQADKFKSWLDEAGAKFGKGAPRESTPAQSVFKDVYSLVKQRAEAYGGEKYAQLNKNLSEVIPIRNVIARTLGRSELGSDVVDKSGIIKTGLNAVASATGLNRGIASGAYNAAGSIRNAAQAPILPAIGQQALDAAGTGMLRGSLVGGL